MGLTARERERESGRDRASERNSGGRYQSSHNAADMPDHFCPPPVQSGKHTSWVAYSPNFVLSVVDCNSLS